MRRSAAALCALALGLAAPGCVSDEAADEVLPGTIAWFDIAFSNDTLRGEPDSPLDFPSAVPARATMKLVARDAYGQVARGYEGVARITVEPGEIVGQGNDRVKFVMGEATVNLAWRFSFDEVHIWVEDVGEDPLFDCADGQDDDGDGVADVRDPDCGDGAPDRADTGDPADGTRATQATGISDPLYFSRPRIRDVQFSPRCTTDTPLGGKNVLVETGTLVVTGTTQSGMYVTDLTGGEGGYNSLYLFTFSNPGDVRRGDRLCSIQGNAAEFIANTQLNFPSFVNADFDRNGVIEPRDLVPCDLPMPELIGPDAVPPPVMLTAAALEGTGGEVPPDFYRPCGLDGEDLDIQDGTSCSQARASIPSELRRESVIDCARDNFALEPYEHALVGFSDAVISTRFERCDMNGDGSIDRSRGNPEGVCEEDCSDDPLCTVLLNLEQFGQFSVGVDCQGADGNYQCAGKIFVATRDTLGGTGYDAMASAGTFYGSIVGHLRQLQPGAGVPSSWVVEPRFIEDFVPPDAPATPDPGGPAP
ncbi:MAG: hypothetical protein H6704_21975 [Myxococcales bacterium]|nr:hypothetical protein [Myxococcales bacterium]